MKMPTEGQVSFMIMQSPEYIFKCRQVSLDCKFLESQNIIDYSLLLGLHFRAPEHLKAPLDQADTMHSPESSFDGDGSYYSEYAFPLQHIVALLIIPSIYIVKVIVNARRAEILF